MAATGSAPGKLGGTAVSPLLAAVMIAIAIALSVLSTLLVAWQPTRVRPLEVLRNE